MEIFHETPPNTPVSEPENRYRVFHSLGLRAIYFGIITAIVAGAAVDRAKEVLHLHAQASANFPDNDVPAPRQLPRSL